MHTRAAVTAQRAKDQALQDFQVLEEIGRLLVDSGFKRDETVPDLKDRLVYNGREGGNAAYFIEPYLSHWAPQLQHRNFIPIPPTISDEFREARYSSLMGLIPEINHAWITVDDKLFLWDYRSPTDFSYFEGMSDVIVSVGLAVPQPQVFLPVVKYLLVVATQVDVVILALATDDETVAPRVQPTKFVVPSDGITMTKIVGTQHGRIFMAGFDGNLYELKYERADDSWGTYLGLQQPHKCRKVKHSPWGLVHVMPPFIRSVVALDPGRLEDVVVDNWRSLLYTFSTTSVIECHYLGSDGLATRRVGSPFDLIRKAREFLARGTRAAPGTPDSSVFQGNHGMHITGLFIVPPNESERVHAVAVLNTGIRIYLTVQTVDALYFTPASADDPAEVEVTHIRSPPPPELFNQLHGGGSEPNGGFEPAYRPANRLRVSRSYYSQGVLMLADGRLEDPDRVIGIVEDQLQRQQGGLFAAGSRQTQSDRRGVQEGVCIVSSEMGLGQLNGKIVDIKEIAPAVLDRQLAMHIALFLTSRGASERPTARRPGTGTGARGLFWSQRNPHSPAQAVVPGPPNALGQGDRLAAEGVPYSELNQVLALSELASQHLMPQRQVLCLTNFGIHVFSKQRPIDYLYQLLANGASQQIELFFELFGLEQSCAMCYSLACGLPTDVGSDSDSQFAIGGALAVSDIIQRQAINAMLQLSEPARFIGTGTTGRNAADARAVVANQFMFSSHHEGLLRFFGRLLRPFWNRTIIIAEPNKPATAECMFNRAQIQDVLQPLDRLQRLLREVFARATQRELSKPVEATSNLPARMMLGLQARRDDQRVQEEDASRQEDRSINAIYRLVARTVQALALLDLLLAASLERRAPVRWDQLSNLTLRELVTSSAAHAKVKLVLTELVRPSNGVTQQVAEDLARELTTRCFMYFAEGDRMAYEATSLISKAASLPIGDPARERMAQEAVDLFCHAAKYWRSLDMISGETGLLNSVCRDLLALGALNGIVDVCFCCASNFGSAIPSRPPAAGAMALSQNGHDARDWERSLYHGGSVKDEQEAAAARACCYDAVISALKKTLFPERKGGMGRDVAAVHAAEGDIRTLHERGDAMLRYMVEQSSDPLFHTQLYTFLKDADPERLVKVESRFVEEFLQKVDQSLLYRYYVQKDRHEDAVGLMENLAGSEGLTLEQRVDYLRKAAQSAKVCLDRTMTGGRHHRRRADHAPIDSGRVQELESRREIAELQLDAVKELKMIHQRVRHARDSTVQALEATIQRLEQSLVSVSELYNDASFPYNLWDLCLRILHACNYDDVAQVQEFWKQIIFRLVPQDARDDDVKQWLQLKRKLLVVDNVRQAQGSFEDSDWPEQLAMRVTALGRQLCGHGADFTFPVELICRELLELGLKHAQVTHSPSSAATDLVVKAMTDIPISYAVLADVFVELLENDREGTFLQATLDLLKNWLNKAATARADTSLAPGSSKSVFQQLVAVVRSRRFDDWLERASSRSVGVGTSQDAQRVRAEIDYIRHQAHKLTQQLRS